ncbi:unnamed protein product [Rotaria sordida]|uniref:RanBP2-type domain-containing protein n=1 Tax=Rotaria sordida TaxID=392033 RepID=A0A819BDJ8_9BILA|nr:unnamed protein product [Rotaria sordida]CAF3800300.1 unnamed protein product [Rotaria sordida]
MSNYIHIGKSNDQQDTKKKPLQWECDNCSYTNDNTATRCVTCKNGKRPERVHQNSVDQTHSNSLPPVSPPSTTLNKSGSSSSRIYSILDSSISSSLRLGSGRTPLPKIEVTSKSSTNKEEMTPEKAAQIDEATDSAKTILSKDTNSSPTCSSSTSAKQRLAIVYIRNLPPEIQDNSKLEHLVRRRVETSTKVQPDDIKCYSKLGIGIIHVLNDEIKDHFVKNIGQMVLDPTKGKMLVSFVSELELVSYIVIDVTKKAKDFTLPTSEEISCRWMELYKGEKPLNCNQLDVQFPNIYRIVTKSLDELLLIMHNQEFSIKKNFAKIYFCADCNFLEDLPRLITEDKLRTAISTTLDETNIPSSSLYIQINKSTGNACILMTDIAKKLSTIHSLHIDDKLILKKDILTCRLLIRSFSQTFPIHEIINHPDFTGKILNHKHSGKNLILELSDKNFFDECLTREVLRIDDKSFPMEIYNILQKPEESEVDNDTWYETEMLKYKPDIIQFISKPDHAIFRYKWNPQIWLDKFNYITPQTHASPIPHDQKDSRNDQLRHQLRVTAMLNTIGIVRKKSYTMNDHKVKLNLDPKLKTIVYDHQSILQLGGKMPIKEPPYQLTTVLVENNDCLVIYERLINSKKRPLLLNMANAKNPGGGYRKGDGAQEENLFRRSDYFRSLDVDLDIIQQQRAERFHCSTKCQLEPLSDPHKMYPMDEFGAIYTSGLTIFRHPENTGYALMEKPLENVCALAMAAYREPTLEGDMLASKYAAGTLKKIQNIFAIAYHHGHDCLVLSAFGCGAFKNPPTHIAKLFLSVIDQYAGFFKAITFAIVDDHNTGNRLNPEGNFKPFLDLFDGMIALPPKIKMNIPHTMFGPYRILSDGLSVSDVRIFDLSPCYFGAGCKDMFDAKHSRNFSHPALCIKSCLPEQCMYKQDVVHMFSFIHRNQCRHGGECRQIDDKKHCQEFEHPSDCPNGSSCPNIEEDHLKQYRHLPLCEHAHKCVEFQKHNQKHCQAFRHVIPRCSQGSFCNNFHDINHTDELQHPFPIPCSFTPFHCQFYAQLSEASDTQKLSYDVQRHCLHFAHVCRFGRECMDKTVLHWEKTIHVARHLCSVGDQCTKLMDEDHLNSFTHKNIPDIRRFCKHGHSCHDRRKPEHIAKYRHAIIFEDSGVVRLLHLNKSINFVQNQMDNIARVQIYVQNQNWQLLPSGSIPHDILDWIRIVQPVHRCNPIIFESILLHGHVMSRDYMENLKKPRFVANSVLQHSRIRRIDALRIKRVEENAREYITALVSEEFEKHGFPQPSTTGPQPPSTQAARPGSATVISVIKQKEKFLSPNIPSNDMKALQKKAIEIARASIELHSNPAGIGHPPDQLLGTNKTVFSILGPHLGHYYGDIFIVFKREILHHPDANFSMQAATSYASGNAYKWRPWLGADPGSNDERIKLFHCSKLHASIPGYEYATALELIAITSEHFKKNSLEIDLKAILQRWINVDSHTNIEAHLPSLIPLDYIDHIYIPQNIYDSLNDTAHRSIDAVFKHRITITQHEGEIKNPAGPFGPTPPTQARADYQNYIIDKLNERFTGYITQPPPRLVQGAVITIPSTNFNDHLVLPLTISQAYKQYCVDHAQPPKDNTIYIYWRAMNGDMMLTLSNEEIDPGEKQPNLRCLICYIAAKSNSIDTPYHENTSYLNSGQPSQHATFLAKKKYAAKSDRFHIGCNTDYFMTYCLEYQCSTGQVTLSHAGPNAIYNHEKITCTFAKGNLDLSNLEFIYVSAGDSIIPIRNFMICFEKQPNLHPTFDSTFKKPTLTIGAKDAVGHIPAKATNDNASNPESISAGVKKSTADDASSSITPCLDNINCLIQYKADESDHNAKFSHPCRFSELCQSKECQRIHETHQVSMCNHDKKCHKLTDPFHRAEFRHTGMPDYLIPCRNQAKCTDTSTQHRMKYSHGEQVYGISSLIASQNASSQQQQNDDRDSQIPCRWGGKCYDFNSQHRAKYAHPKSDDRQQQEPNDHRALCKWGTKCYDSTSQHRTKYWHPESQEGEQQGQDDHRMPCKWGSQCRMISDVNHRSKYSHPSTEQK